jgi:methionyl aminopeptidase
MVLRKTPQQIAHMRKAGSVVAEMHEACTRAAKPGATTGDLDAAARDVLDRRGARSNFLNYHGFPAVACISPNEVIVHGIPGDRVINDGDIVSIDCGAIVDGYHGDAAVTVPVGNVKPELLELLRVTEESLWHGIAAARLGGRLIDISRGIEDYIRSQRHPFADRSGGGSWGIVEEYVGHGIGTEMHQDPQVYNYVGRRMAKGPELVKGLALAVEPMINLGGRSTRVLDDGWTVVTEDGSPSAHFEHTFTLTERGPWVLTALDGGEERLSRILSVGAA